MNKLTAYTQTGVPIQEIDLDEEVTAPLIYKIADIRSVGMKGGAFSKTIKLPFTPNNHLFFGGLYDVNVDYTVYNTNLKTWVRLVVTDEETMNGYMKLNKIVVDDTNEGHYEIVIYDTTVDFWSNIEGKFVFELASLDDLSHFWSSSNIKQSWTTDWDQMGVFYPVLQNSVTQGNVGGGIVIPRTYTERLYPALFHKRLLDMIITEQGYTWSGTLKTNEVYEREIIPYTGDHPNVTLSESEERKFKAGFNADQVGYNSYHPALVNAGYIRDTNRTDWNYLGTQVFPNESGGVYGFNDNFSVWSSPLYTAPSPGKYAYNLKLTLQAQLEYYKSGNPNTNLDYSVNFMVYAEIDTGTGTITSSGIPLSGFDWWFANNLANTSSTFVTQVKTDSLVFPASSAGLGSYASGDYFVLASNWTVRFYIGYSSQGLRKAQSGQPPYYSGNLNANKEFRIESFGFKPLAGTFVECHDALMSYGEDSYIPFKAWINKAMKQKDIFSDLIARYNAHIYMNPDKANDIVIDTGETFYDPAPEDTEDWSEKKEHDIPDQIVHMAELQSERLLLTYKESSDVYSTSYKGNVGEIYGQHEHRFDNAFVKGVNRVETPFTETPIVEIGEMYYPAVEASTKDGAMRVLYAPKGGLQMKTWNSLRYFSLIGASSVETLGVGGSFYPYAGHYQNPNAINDTTIYGSTTDNDINFGSLAYLFPQSLLGVTSLPVHTLERRYWGGRIDQMNRGKMLTASFDLTSFDVNKIRRKPYMRIWVNNAYWQVNKISFEGNDNLKKLSEVELVSINNLRHIKGRIIKPVKPTLGSWGGVGGTISSSTNSVGLGSINYDIKGTHNVIGSNSDGVYIHGDENTVGSNQRNIEIKNSSRVKVYASNVTVIGTNDITIRVNDATVINGVIYLGDKSAPLFNVVDGGTDEVRSLNSRFKINLIDSGENRIFNTFSDSPVATIDTDNGLNDDIKTIDSRL